MKKHCLLACLLSALALAACGNASSDEAAEVEAAIRAAVLDPDPSDCTEFRTQRYLEQGEQKPGEAALKECEAEAADPANINTTDSVAISELEIDWETATAQLAPDGGALDGQVVAIAAVKEKGQWKLDQLTRFVEFDASAFARATEKTVRKRGASPEQTGCIGEQLEEKSRREVEALVLPRRPTDEARELLQACAGSVPAAGQRVSPQGAEYSYLLPAGFAPAEPTIRFQPATAPSAVALVGAEGGGQGILVGQVPGVPIRNRAQLRRALPLINEEFAESAALVGAETSPAKTLEIEGSQAVQRETEGGTVGPYPGTDFRETVIFAHPETILVVCRWKVTGAERDEILEGCDAILRTLRLSDPTSLATTS
ncbi:MAG TPA: hypothetical protein VFX45_10790 [Solirubrobacterales bacterium]|nr:hypothetical protein [Solirubrobacterales bacterium]